MKTPPSEVYNYCINTMPLFQSLETSQFMLIKQEVKEQKLKPGEHLYRAGDIRDTLFLIQRGSIKIYRLSSDGKEHTISILQAATLSGNKHYSTNKRAITMLLPLKIQPFASYNKAISKQLWPKIHKLP